MWSRFGRDKASSNRLEGMIRVRRGGGAGGMGLNRGREMNMDMDGPGSVRGLGLSDCRIAIRSMLMGIDYFD